MPSSTIQDQRFSSRWGFLLSALGIAIGTGNIWRFPRIVAQNVGDEGAGAFIIAWIIFLFAWSIPLIIGEYAIGLYSRKGVIGAIMVAAGKKFAWMGSFMTFVAMAITFFYSVVLGWCLYYFIHSIFNDLPSSTALANQTWDTYQSGIWPLISHGVVMLLGGVAIWKGVSRIERLNKVLIPVLLVILVVALGNALFLDGAGRGIQYLFTIDWKQFGDPGIWVAALTQNAWDTGAGWGLFITYGAYMQMRFGIVKNAVITAVGNNIISLMCAIMIFGTCFAVMGSSMGSSDQEILEVMKNSGPASTGLTFIWMPQLFERILYGKVLTIFFFLGLALAGFSSLISQLEMTVRTFVDAGVKRTSAIVMIVILSYVVGIPSAVNLNILSNQDFVWGLALLISGAFFAFALIRFKVTRVREEILIQNPDDLRLTPIWDKVISYFIPVAAIVLLSWWLASDAMSDDWYNPLGQYSLMTCLLQWGLILLIAISANRWLVKKIEKNS